MSGFVPDANQEGCRNRSSRERPGHPAPLQFPGLQRLTTTMSQLFSLRQDGARTVIFPSQIDSILAAFPVLARFIDGIADWDVPNGDLAKTLAIKVLPSTMPYLIVQYRDSMKSSRRFGDASSPHGRYRHIVTKADT